MFGPSFLAIKKTEGTYSRVLDCLVTTKGNPSSMWSLLMKGYSFAVFKDTQKDQMSDEKEVKWVVLKSLIEVLWLIAGGLLVNGLQFLVPDPINP